MKRIVVGITGASGAIYGVRLLQHLVGYAESHLVLSAASLQTIPVETGLSDRQVRSMATYSYDIGDFQAPIASGSFHTDGMVVLPCSIKTLSGVAHSYSDSLLLRAADVTLKQRRTLVLAVRETPLHAGHLELMSRAAACGAIVAPPVPAFYHRPASIEDLVDHYLYMVLDLLGINVPAYRRWSGPPQAS